MVAEGDGESQQKPSDSGVHKTNKPSFEWGVWEQKARLRWKEDFGSGRRRALNERGIYSYSIWFKKNIYIKGKLITFFIWGKKKTKKKSKIPYCCACPREKLGQVQVVECTIYIYTYIHKYICIYFLSFFYRDIVFNTYVRKIVKIQWTNRKSYLLRIIVLGRSSPIQFW